MKKGTKKKKLSYYSRRKLSRKVKASWTPERKAAQAEKARAYWQGRKNGGAKAEGRSPSISAVVIDGKRFVSVESVNAILKVI